MSELITARDARADYRQQFLTTVSALALLASVCLPGETKAEEADRPTVWIELGGQLERFDGSQEQIIPPFIVNSPRASVWTQSPASVQRPSRYAVGAEGKITFEPEGTNWVFTAQARYGRSNGKKDVGQQSNVPTMVIFGPQHLPAPPVEKLSDQAHGQNTESHTILDFMAGKDVGLGMFGKSTINLGVRFAQFATKSSMIMKSRQTLGNIRTKYPAYNIRLNYYFPRNYDASANDARSFHGVGPSLSWDGSTPLAGHPDSGHFTLDWGVNAAVLFGRQKVRTQHETSGHHLSLTGGGTKYKILSQYQYPHHRISSRSVVVPNVGGFAGVSFAFPNAKLSLGYRADFFFGAMDGGFDAHKTYDRSFYGPFATISIGLGG